MFRVFLRRWVAFTFLHVLAASACAVALTTPSIRDRSARLRDGAARTMNVLLEPLQRLGAYREAAEPRIYFLYLLNSAAWGVGLALLWTLIRRPFRRTAPPKG